MELIIAQRQPPAKRADIRRQGRSPEKARDIILSLIAEKYEQAAIYLFLADLYEKDFKAPSSALSALENSLKIRSDSEVEKRYRELKEKLEKEITAAEATVPETETATPEASAPSVPQEAAPPSSEPEAQADAAVQP